VPIFRRRHARHPHPSQERAFRCGAASYAATMTARCSSPGALKTGGRVAQGLVEAAAFEPATPGRASFPLFSRRARRGTASARSAPRGTARLPSRRTDEGKRYQISGKIAVGSLFTIDGDPNGSLGMVNASRFNELAAFTLQVKLVA
jgi:hypothetical protein